MSNSATTGASTTFAWIIDQGAYVFGPLPVHAADAPNLVSEAFGYWVKSDGLVPAAELPEALRDLDVELGKPESLSFGGAVDALEAAGWVESCPSERWWNYDLPGQFSATLEAYDHERFELRVPKL